MGKSCTVFKDLGKACNDLLTKDFKQVGTTTVELKSSTASGVTFTPKAEKKESKDGAAISGELKAAYALLPWLDGEATFATDGGISCQLEAADALTKGLTVTLECDKAKPDPKGKPVGFFSKANLILDYKTELFTCKTSFDYMKKDLLASCSTVYGALTCGADCTYATSKGELAKGAAACQFVQPDFIVSGKYEMAAKKDPSISCALYHKVSPLMQVGVGVKKPLSGSAFDVDFGCQYKLDKDTTVKSKVDAKGKLSLAYKQKISSLTTMTLAAEINACNLTATDHKFGLALNITP